MKGRMKLTDEDSLITPEVNEEQTKKWRKLQQYRRPE
jgi:hypothetical protein